MLSIFEISYERKKREFAIVGHTLLLDQSLFSDWRSVSVEFPEQDVVWYMYKARIHRDQPKDVFGISRLVFLERLGTYGRFIEMKGTYSDVSSGGREIPFTATRASRKEIQEIRKHPLDERMLLDSSPKGKLDREEVKAAGPQG